MSELEDLGAAKAELRRCRNELRTLRTSSSPDSQEVLKAKVGVAEAELDVAKAELGVAKAELGVAKAKEDTPEQKIAELKQNVAKAAREVAKADWELAKARNEDEGDITIKKRAYEMALEEGQF